MAFRNREESVKGLMMLKLFVRKIQRGLLHSSASKAPNLDTIDEQISAAKVLPEDVRQGHFAAIAVKGGEPKRFVLELDYLSDPAFMKLLEQAEEEYGFQQQGVLSIPCQPEELQAILGDRRRRRMSTEW
ncbi:auxin-responsive protein SAUR19 [Ricinus communis]|uniref:Calmodulin binding protein, putative n=1 Tax=Ricinus communis TaxID=3988 RepID=B9S0H7_RICCO|nr:auxin-responsive protein SAUR19 [Ricinus communis]EEF42910.1 calmodulin binding protein, putative [Ricinus communis]|eukprot:XP_002519496.1 auxin-responsive protein SAUR19 [Ricinus communis]